MSRPLVIVDIVSDILCPFCWVGKRSLEKAITLREGKVDVQVRWHPFFLRRGVPEAGIDKLMAYTEKFGRERAEQILLSDQSPIRVHGRRLGLEFNYKEGCVVPNSMPGHRLLMYTLEKHGAAVQNKLMEAIFRRYFQECLNVGTPDTLVEAGLEAGLKKEEVLQVFNSEVYLSEVQQNDKMNIARGINGVPNMEFYLEGAGKLEKLQTSGAQEPEYFAMLIDKAAKL